MQWVLLPSPDSVGWLLLRGETHIAIWKADAAVYVAYTSGSSKLEPWQITSRFQLKEILAPLLWPEQVWRMTAMQAVPVNSATTISYRGMEEFPTTDLVVDDLLHRLDLASLWSCG